MFRALVVACLLSLFAADAQARLLGRRNSGSCDSGSGSQGCNISGQRNEAEPADVIRTAPPTPAVAPVAPRPQFNDEARLRKGKRLLLNRDACRAFCAVEPNPMQVLPTATTERFVSR